MITEAEKRMTKAINFRISKELHDAAMQKAKAMGITLSQLVRLLLFEIVRAEKNDLKISIR